jgi:Domain of unknown function (DUF4157)
MKFILKLLVLAILAAALAISFAFVTGSPATKPYCDSRCQAKIKSTISTVKSSTASSVTIQDLLHSSEPAEVWGNSGIIMFNVAAKVTDNRNPGSQELTTTQKKSLRPLFGPLVDRVRVNYNAQLMDRWSNGNEEFHVGDVDSAAQTFCDRVYLREVYQPNNRGQLALLAHELTHSLQCERLGGANKFGYKYFKSYYQVGQRYADNPLEKEARSIARKLAT